MLKTILQKKVSRLHQGLERTPRLMVLLQTISLMSIAITMKKLLRPSPVRSQQVPLRQLQVPPLQLQVLPQQLVALPLRLQSHLLCTRTLPGAEPWKETLWKLLSYLALREFVTQLSLIYTLRWGSGRFWVKCMIGSLIRMTKSSPKSEMRFWTRWWLIWGKLSST